MLYRVDAFTSPFESRWTLAEAESPEEAVRTALSWLVAENGAPVSDLQKDLDNGILHVSPAVERDEDENACPVLKAEEVTLLDFDTAGLQVHEDNIRVVNGEDEYDPFRELLKMLEQDAGAYA